MVKGIGLGWGTPYMFRMAVRETGKVTYGVCLLDDNGEFSWNDGSDDSFGIKKDQWFSTPAHLTLRPVATPTRTSCTAHM